MSNTLHITYETSKVFDRTKGYVITEQKIIAMAYNLQALELDQHNLDLVNQIANDKNNTVTVKQLESNRFAVTIITP